ncbi:TPA: hypothetical protein ACLBZX_005179 [Bacillus cereus]|uniref:hypothetical protein n=1 Tax=Bacillus cereus group TaxID=86661 RepID=UPI000BA27D50|nr:hypothetical protein [Bacillus thuringiensis]
MAQEITVGMTARLTDSFTVTEVMYDEYPHVDTDDFVHFARGTVVQEYGCKQSVIYSDVLKEATTCLADYLEPMNMIYIDQISGYVEAGKKIRG